MAGRLTTHVLDTERGAPGGGIKIALVRRSPDPESLLSLTLGEDGRATLLEGQALRAGSYELTFFVGDYQRGRGVDATDWPFLDQVPIRFGISDPDSHYHVPLVFSRFGYTTYRGG